jgi:DeoR family transcriptional regulator, glycerol-3-phosphate regulon repressor
VRIGHMSDVNVFVTDQMPPESVLEVCRRKGVKIELTTEATMEEQEKVA